MCTFSLLLYADDYTSVLSHFPLSSLSPRACCGGRRRLGATAGGFCKVFPKTPSKCNRGRSMMYAFGLSSRILKAHAMPASNNK